MDEQKFEQSCHQSHVWSVKGWLKTSVSTKVPFRAKIMFMSFMILALGICLSNESLRGRRGHSTSSQTLHKVTQYSCMFLLAQEICQIALKLSKCNKQYPHLSLQSSLTYNTDILALLRRMDKVNLSLQDGVFTELEIPSTDVNALIIKDRPHYLHIEWRVSQWTCEISSQHTNHFWPFSLLKLHLALAFQGAKRFLLSEEWL